MSNVTTYDVLIGDPPEKVGQVRSTVVRSKELSHFRYSDAWLQHRRSFALSPALPLSDYWQHFAATAQAPGAALPGVLRDAAPDGWGRSIIERSTGARTETDFLLAVDDRTRLGALRFADSNGVLLSSNEPPIPRLTDLRRLHGLCAALETGSAHPRAIARDLRGALAIMGGARPKSVVMDEQGAMHLAKFTMTGDTRPVECSEYAAAFEHKQMNVALGMARSKSG